MRALKAWEAEKVDVYMDLTSPDTFVKECGDHWEIQILREDTEVFRSTDDLMGCIDENLEAIPVYVWEMVCSETMSRYLEKYGKYWKGGLWDDGEGIDPEGMTAWEMRDEETMSKKITFMENWIADQEGR